MLKKTGSSFFKLPPVILYTSGPLSGLHNVLHENGSGDGAYTAGNGGDGIHDGGYLVKLGIAGDGALAALGVGLVLVPVDGHINDHLTGPDVVGGQRVQHTGGGDDDVSALADFGGVGSVTTSVLMKHVVEAAERA